MEQKKKYRITKIAKEFGVGVSTLLEFFAQEGVKKLSPNSKIDDLLYGKALKQFGSDKIIKEKILEQKEKEAELYNKKEAENKEEVVEELKEEKIEEVVDKEIIEPKKEEKKEIKEKVELKKEEIKKEERKLVGPKIVGKIDVHQTNKKNKKIEQKKKIVIDKPVEKKKEEIEDKTLEKKQEKKKEVVENKSVEKKQDKKEEIIKNVKVVEKKIEKVEHISEKKDDVKKIEEEKKKTGEIKEKIVEEKIKKVEDLKKIEDSTKLKRPKVLGKIDLGSMNMKTRPDKKTKKEKEAERLKRQKEANKNKIDRKFKKKRPRIQKVKINEEAKVTNKRPVRKRPVKKKIAPVTDAADVQKQVKETLQKLEQRQKSKAAKFRKQKRLQHQKKISKEKEDLAVESKIIKVTEFVTVKELAALMDTPAAQVIELCFDLGQPVTINYRLEAELISMITEEFNHTVEFVETSFEEELEKILKEESNQVVSRPPIVTVMGHVDHGKTSLLDYIREANVVDSESGGITQHIGAYSVNFDKEKTITFIDTPGHEAFTSMRARGTKVTDIAVIIIAADDSIMPQTEEAIDHSKAADVPMVFAINKIDKPGADPEKIKQQLAEKNLLVEDWGGKYGCVEISAKKGTGVEDLLERVWLEAELLELKSNPERKAIATVLEAKLDKGRGYITNLIIRTGTLNVGDVIVAGAYYGKVKAMYNEKNKKMDKVGPSYPTQLLGLNGAPEPGESVIVVDSEREAREKAEQKMQILREMELRARKKHTLEELSRRFVEGEKIDLNFIVKADVKGSVDAIVDQVTRLSNDEISVNVVRNAVGQISDTDVMLAAASKAILIGFNIKPSVSARKLADDKDVEIRNYSIIYDIINDVKAAVKGLLKLEIKEEIVGSAEVMGVFKVSKVGTIAGSMVRDGKITQNAKVRVVRDGVVVHTGKLNSLKRFKDDVKEVLKGFDCGIGIQDFNDVKVGDFIETFIEVEVERID